MSVSAEYVPASELKSAKAYIKELEARELGLIATKQEDVKRIKELEAQLKIAARDYVAVCDYPLAPFEAIKSWELETGNE